MVHLVNVTGVAALVSLCYVPSGESESSDNAVLFDYEIPANDFIEFGEGDALNPLTVIRAKASVGNAINLRITGVQE